jgi:hypothetical protein
MNEIGKKAIEVEILRQRAKRAGQDAAIDGPYGELVRLIVASGAPDYMPVLDKALVDARRRLTAIAGVRSALAESADGLDKKTGQFLEWVVGFGRDVDAFKQQLASAGLPASGLDDWRSVLLARLNGHGGLVAQSLPTYEELRDER